MARSRRSLRPPQRGEVWIVDGHNVINRIDALRELHDSGRREDARDRLAQRALGFGRRYGVTVLIVFDGPRDGKGGGRRQGCLEVTYGSGPDGADDLIVHRAEGLIAAGGAVVVVTEDRGLSRRLPRSAAVTSAPALWPRGRAAGADGEDEEKPTLRDPELEAWLLAREEEPPPPRAPRKKKPRR